MSKADTDHKNGDGLMSGLGIANGIPNSNPRLEPTPTLGGGGTLTGLALRDDGTKVLVTCQHVMAGYTLENVGGVGVRAYTTARGTERMYHPTMANAHQVSASLVAVPLSSSDPNKVDLATVGMAASVNASYRLHDPNHSGTGREGSGAHAARRIVSGTVDPAVLMRENKKVTLIGAKTGEGTAYIKGVNLGYGDDYGDQVWVYRRRFVGVMKIFMPDGMTFINGDSGSPVLMEVQNGVYKMVGIIFAIDGRDNTILAFPASAAQTAAGITFGEPLPPVPSLNEMDSFDDYAYGTWRALTDFDDVEHRLHNVDLYNSRVRWLGSSVPGTGPNYHWWSVGVPSGNENPTSVRFSVRGSPEIDEDFRAGPQVGIQGVREAPGGDRVDARVQRRGRALGHGLHVRRGRQSHRGRGLRGANHEFGGRGQGVFPAVQEWRVRGEDRGSAH